MESTLCLIVFNFFFITVYVGNEEENICTCAAKGQIGWTQPCSCTLHMCSKDRVVLICNFSFAFHFCQHWNEIFPHFFLLTSPHLHSVAEIFSWGDLKLDTDFLRKAAFTVSEWCRPRRLYQRLVLQPSSKLWLTVWGVFQKSICIEAKHSHDVRPNMCGEQEL